MKENEYEEEETQTYTPTPITTKTEDNKKRDLPLGDAFDLYGMASAVHSQTTDMTRDYTLAKLDSDIINNKFAKFIREQRKTIRVIKSFLLIPKQKLTQRYGNQKATQIHQRLKEDYEQIQTILLGELDEMVILSRAGKGQVTTAMLTHGRSKEERDEYDQQLKDQGIREKLTEKKK